jgi:hypothetical protein
VFAGLNSQGIPTVSPKKSSPAKPRERSIASAKERINLGPGPHFEFKRYTGAISSGKNQYTLVVMSVPRVLRRIADELRGFWGTIVKDPHGTLRLNKLLTEVYFDRLVDRISAYKTPEHAKRLKELVGGTIANYHNWEQRRLNPRNMGDYPDPSHVTGLGPKLLEDSYDLRDAFDDAAYEIEAFADVLEKAHSDEVFKLSPLERARLAINRTIAELRKSAELFEDIPYDVISPALEGDNAAVGKTLSIFERAYHPASEVLRQRGLPPEFCGYIQAKRSKEEMDSIQKRFEEVLDTWDTWYEKYCAMRIHRNNLLRLRPPEYLDGIEYQDLGWLTSEFTRMPLLLNNTADWLEIYSLSLQDATISAGHVESTTLQPVIRNNQEGEQEVAGSKNFSHMSPTEHTVYSLIFQSKNPLTVGAIAEKLNELQESDAGLDSQNMSKKCSSLVKKGFLMHLGKGSGYVKAEGAPPPDQVRVVESKRGPKPVARRGGPKGSG